MGGYAYDPFKFMYEVNASVVKPDESVKKIVEYHDLLRDVQKRLSTADAKAISEAVEDDSKAGLVKAAIIRYVNRMRVTVADMSFQDAIDRLYKDMVQFSFLTDLLKDPSVEEINAMRWNDIEVINGNGYRKLTGKMERFVDKGQAIDVVKRLFRYCGKVIDSSHPRGDGFLPSGVRIHAHLAPICDEDAGVTFSIRRQRNCVFTEDELIRMDTASRDELDLIKLCASHGISVGFAGSTSSGKTTDLAFTLSSLPKKLKIYIIEDTREIYIDTFDEFGNYLGRVVYNKTRLDENAASSQRITASDLVRDSLRSNPNVLVCAEMRGAEALHVQEAARTGHTVMTTLHANNAKDAYTRIQSMCAMSSTTTTESTLKSFAYQAFPIMCFKAQLADCSRKIMQIVEAVEVDDGVYKIVPIFEYVVFDSEHDEEGNVTKISGEHRRVNPISKTLADRLFTIGGAPLKEIQRFCPDFNPASRKEEQ